MGTVVLFLRRGDIHRFPDVREESRNVRYGAGAPLHGFGLPVPRPRQLADMSVKEWFRWLVGSHLNRCCARARKGARALGSAEPSGGVLGSSV